MRLLIVFLLIAAISAALVGCTLELGSVALCFAVIGLFAAFFVGVLFLYVLGLFVFSLCIDKDKPRTKDRPFVRFLIAETVQILCLFGRVRIRVEGMEKLPSGRFLLVSNHRSMFDPIVVLAKLYRYPIAFITKPENLKIPLVGRIIRYACFLSIDRENPRNAIRTVNAAASLIKEDTVSVGVYPEGTRNRGGKDVLLPFHAGTLMIAQKSNAPVVVLSTQGTEQIAKNFPLHRTDVLLRVCEVIPAEQVLATRAVDLSDVVRGILEKDLTKEKNV